MKKHLKLILFSAFVLGFCSLTVAQNTADYPDNAAAPGSQNVRVGFQTANGIGAGDDQNTFSGAFAGAGLNGFFGSSHYGYQAGLEHNGALNTFIGYNSGIGGNSEATIHIGYETGSGSFGFGNVFLGAKAGAGRGNINEQLYINVGDGTPLIYGDFSDNVVGINTEDPLGTLDVRGGSILLTDPGVTAGTFTTSRSTALGQNGGPGGSALCNLYGFRSQNNITNSINVGMNGNNPTVLWDNGSADILTFSRRTTSSGLACQAQILRLGNNIGGTYEFDLNGDGRVSASWLVLSDKRIKSDISAIDNALDLITQLDGVSYSYNQSKYPEMNLPEGRVFGFIAQDVKKVIPQVTSTSSEDDMVGIKYTEIIPLLTEGIKEQQAIIEDQEDLISELDTKVTELEDRLAAIEKSLVLDGASSKREDASNMATALKSIKMSQNRPNPFSEFTTVEYVIPQNTTNARLDVFSMDGKLMTSYDIQGGEGRVDIQSNSLQSGTYVYAINIDGANVATNIMIIQK
ncbi:MAG: tail fiber domain-containing protein [Saprospiraceae bacterium]|nr:tail fiber domain-containing protein [Saprospiraceae bacterium]